MKSWRFDTFYPEAKKRYLVFQTSLGISVWEPYPVVRMLQGAEEINNWSARCAQEDYSALVSELPDGDDWNGLLRSGHHFGLIEQAARVNFQNLLPAYREHLKQSGKLMEEEVRPDQIPDFLQHFDTVIFCEGYRSTENPYFPALPWRLAKGEALMVRIESLQARKIGKMLKKQIMLAPLGDGLFWAGGTYQWHFPDLLPSAGEGALLKSRLEEMLAVPFEIVDHLAAVRPTVIHRRPLIGKSRHQENVYLFNGLGTKGALLAPYMANLLADHLLKGAALETDVDISAL